MNELSVALTDYVITLISLSFVCYLYRSVNQKNLILTQLFSLFFLSIATASLLGGTVHGFFVDDETTFTQKILWSSTLLAIGVTAASCWLLGGFFLHGRDQLSKWIVFASCLFFIYAGAVVFYTQKFFIAILNYAPAMLFLLVVMVLSFLRTKITYFGWIIIGILVSFLAAAVQQFGIGLHPTYFNHNSTYHLVQAVGLYFIFIGAKGLVTMKRSF